MNISMELRWILIACGIALLAAIYWWGRRGDRRAEPVYERGRPEVEPGIDPDFDSFEAPYEPAVDATPSGGDGEEEFDRTVVLDDINTAETRLESMDWPEIKVHETHEAVTESHATLREPEAAAPVLTAARPTPVLSPAGRMVRDDVSARATGAKPAEQRKIVALRLAIAGPGLAGADLLKLLQGAGLQHGKFGIFHSVHAGGSVFSVASMIEPGTFDLATIELNRYPGLTLFMLLPGPIDGAAAFDRMLSFAQRLAEASGGTLQDERGKPLTPHTVDRLRDEVFEFQQLHGGAASVGN